MGGLMGILNKYNIKSINSSLCKEWFLKKHYAHRIPPVSYAFGLFHNNLLIGVCSFGRPVSFHLKNGVAGKENSELVYELNRLIINENLEKNTLSFFVSQCLKLLPKPMIIVSYSDMAQNHHGYIYQACNFIYTGLSIAHNDYAIKGMEHLHNATIFEKTKRGSANRLDQLKEIYGDLLYTIPRDRKHRYIYFLGDKRQLKNLKPKLKYKIEPFPKGDNKRYDASYTPIVQQQLF